MKLNDEEKFKDIKNNVLEITIHGKHDKCYFKLADVSDKFKLPNLNKTIQNTASSYQKIKDYIVFLKDSRKDKYKLYHDENNKKLVCKYYYNAEPINTVTYFVQEKKILDEIKMILIQINTLCVANP